MSCDHRVGEPVIGGALGESHSQHDQPDEIGGRITPDRDTRAPCRLIVGRIIRWDRLLGILRLHEADDRGNRYDRHHTDGPDVHGERHGKEFCESSETGAHNRSDTEERVIDGHGGTPQGAFVGRSGYVHGHITGTECGPVDRQCGESEGETVDDGGADRGQEQADRRDEERDEHDSPSTEQRDEMTRGDEPRDRADCAPEQQRSDLARVEAQALGDERNPCRPTREAHAAEREHHEDRVAPAHDLRARDGGRGSGCHCVNGSARDRLCVPGGHIRMGTGDAREHKRGVGAGAISSSKRA